MKSDFKKSNHVRTNSYNYQNNNRTPKTFEFIEVNESISHIDSLNSSKNTLKPNIPLNKKPNNEKNNTQSNDSPFHPSKNKNQSTASFISSIKIFFTKKQKKNLLISFKLLFKISETKKEREIYLKHIISKLINKKQLYLKKSFNQFYLRINRVEFQKSFKEMFLLEYLRKLFSLRNIILKTELTTFQLQFYFFKWKAFKIQHNEKGNKILKSIVINKSVKSKEYFLMRELFSMFFLANKRKKMLILKEKFFRRKNKKTILRIGNSVLHLANCLNKICLKIFNKMKNSIDDKFSQLKKEKEIYLKINTLKYYFSTSESLENQEFSKNKDLISLFKLKEKLKVISLDSKKKFNTSDFNLKILKLTNMNIKLSRYFKFWNQIIITESFNEINENIENFKIEVEEMKISRIVQIFTVKLQNYFNDIRSTPSFSMSSENNKISIKNPSLIRILHKFYVEKLLNYLKGLSMINYFTKGRKLRKIIDFSSHQFRSFKHNCFILWKTTISRNLLISMDLHHKQVIFQGIFKLFACLTKLLHMTKLSNFKEFKDFSLQKQYQVVKYRSFLSVIFQSINNSLELTRKSTFSKFDQRKVLNPQIFFKPIKLGVSTINSLFHSKLKSVFNEIFDVKSQNSISKYYSNLIILPKTINRIENIRKAWFFKKFKKSRIEKKNIDFLILTSQAEALVAIEKEISKKKKKIEMCRISFKMLKIKEKYKLFRECKVKSKIFEKWRKKLQSERKKIMEENTQIGDYNKSKEESLNLINDEISQIVLKIHNCIKKAEKCSMCQELIEDEFSNTLSTLNIRDDENTGINSIPNFQTKTLHRNIKRRKENDFETTGKFSNLNSVANNDNQAQEQMNLDENTEMEYYFYLENIHKSYEDKLFDLDLEFNCKISNLKGDVETLMKEVDELMSQRIIKKK